MLNYFRRRALRNRVSRVFGVPLTHSKDALLVLVFFAMMGAVLGIVFFLGGL